MKGRLKKLIGLIIAAALMLHSLIIVPVYAENLTGSVVINEIAWMGSGSSSSDEWIELYNPMDFDVDISGWTILDDDTTEYLIESGTLPAGGYFLIASNAGAAGVEADAIMPLSLSNSGDSLVLNDDSANQIDEVNLNGGAWYAGDNSSKLTMERIDAGNLLDGASNWANSKKPGGSPKDLNQQETPLIELVSSDAALSVGDTVTLTAQISHAKDLFSYGMDLSYDPEFLEFITATEGLMLAENGTSFQSGLENATAGKLIIAGATIEDVDFDVPGADGSGELFILEFKMLKTGETTVNFENTSFISNTNAEIAADFAGIGLTIEEAGGSGGTPNMEIVDVKNLQASLGESAYKLKIDWDSAEYADKYKILRENVKGEFVEMGETTETEFIDDKEIIPFVIYQYKVIPYLGDEAGKESLVEITETRGLKGDNDQSNRVDGRDLMNLARSFGAEVDKDSQYRTLNDTDFDGIIDGNDLLDIGANWALVYTE